jgi:heme exporter protein A
MPLVIENLTVARGGRIVVEKISAVVAPGEALALVGPNGAGKTTLLRTLAGFIAAETGSVSFRTEPPLGDDDAPVAELSHWIGHLDAINGALTVAENAYFWSAWLGGPASGVGSALRRVGLHELIHAPARFLSAGQRRRLALSRLILAQRPIWLLDEPTASLDQTGQEMLATLAAEHVAAGGLIVAATHLPLGFARRELRLGAGANP